MFVTVLVLRLDIPECDTNKGGCDHSCAETPGGFLCKCNTGYVLNDNGKTCDSKCLCNISLY